MKKVLVPLAILLGVAAIVAAMWFYNKEKVAGLEKQVELKDAQIEDLQAQLNHEQKTNGALLARMEDLSIIGKEGSESIRQSLQSINQQYSFIEDLTHKIQTKDSINLDLVMNLKRSLDDLDDEDVEIEVKGGVVYVSISDKLLFDSGSAKISSEANGVLEKVANIINDHNELNILVEGHTDTEPIDGSCIIDNWDLSAKRATAVVRKLENDFYVSPERLTAAGRSSYIPKSDNETEVGRARNRRTEILIMPRFDQFFELLRAPELAN